MAGPLNTRMHVPAGKLGQDPKFLNHLSHFNNNIHSTGEFELRQQIFQSNDQIIARQNEKADILGGNTLRLKHNPYSTMSSDEYRAHMGLD